MKKRMVLTAICLLLCVVCVGCKLEEIAFVAVMSVLDAANNDEKSFDELNRLFLRDFDAIDAAVQSGQYDGAAKLSWIDSANAGDGYADFGCGGSGFGSQTNYTGFFYTPDDDPFALWSSDTAADFVETGDGWEYREHDHNPGGDNVYRVQKLAPCYYYYWLHY